MPPSSSEFVNAIIEHVCVSVCVCDVVDVRFGEQRLRRRMRFRKSSFTNDLHIYCITLRNGCVWDVCTYMRCCVSTAHQVNQFSVASMHVKRISADSYAMEHHHNDKSLIYFNIKSTQLDNITRMTCLHKVMLSNVCKKGGCIPTPNYIALKWIGG